MKASIAVFGQNRGGGPVPRERYGNKAAVLAEMADLGVPVPAGFALPVECCEAYFAGNRRLPGELPALLQQGIGELESATGLVFGSPRRPLLVSVRSGAAISMPGVMETILNVGLTRATVEGLILRTGNPRFAWDCYRRFLAQYGEVVMGHEPVRYRNLVREAMETEEIPDEAELDTRSLRNLAGQFERLHAEAGSPFPQDPAVQLAACTEAVLRSWEGARAEAFRRLRLAEAARGTAVTVQAMVFGNLGSASGAGVAFTRNPWNGERGLLLDFRFGAQGEEVVSGEQSGLDQDAFVRVMPEQFSALAEIGGRLERHFGDMQDIEFTIEEGRLFILQCRTGKRTPLAALRIAVDLVEEHVIHPHEGAVRLAHLDLQDISIRRVAGGDEPIATGTPASGGVISGTIALTSDRAEAEGKTSAVILVRRTASPDDIAGIQAAGGLLVSRGGRTSHAAVVARQLGRVCVVNCIALTIDTARHRCAIGDVVFHEGDTISIDGDTGHIYRGTVTIVEKRPTELLDRVRGWAGRDE
jgi:pyruvate,orthophosphate dikinase